MKEILLQDSTNNWHPIPITEHEERWKKYMNKKELLTIINSISLSLPETSWPNYNSLNKKTKSDLLMILQELRNIYDTDRRWIFRLKIKIIK